MNPSTQTKMEKYAEIEALIEKKATQIATEVYNKLGTRYNVAKVPVHTHNGVDTVRIEQKDLILNQRYNTFLISDVSETFQIKNIPNLSQINFLGFAADNAGGGAATKRLVLNGQANFGKCFTFSGTGSSISLDTTLAGIPFIQSGNFMYVNGSATVTSSRVGASNQFFIYGTDGTNEVVTVTVDSYTTSSIVLTVTLAAGWKLQGSLILT